MQNSNPSLEAQLQKLTPAQVARVREYVEHLLAEPQTGSSSPENVEPGPDAVVSLREITAETLRPIIRLSDTLTPPKKTMVAPNAVSIAEAYFGSGLCPWRFPSRARGPLDARGTHPDPATTLAPRGRRPGRIQPGPRRGQPDGQSGCQTDQGNPGLHVCPTRLIDRPVSLASRGHKPKERQKRNP